MRNDMKKLITLQDELADAEVNFEEAEESGDMETRLEIALRIEDIKNEILHESLHRRNFFDRASDLDWDKTFKGASSCWLSWDFDEWWDEFVAADNFLLGLEFYGCLDADLPS